MKKRRIPWLWLALAVLAVGDVSRQNAYGVDPADPAKLKGVRVRVGITDGTNTEIVQTDHKEGDAVVVSVTGAPTPAATPAANSGPPRRMF